MLLSCERTRRWTGVAASLLGAVLLAGCAQPPRSGAPSAAAPTGSGARAADTGGAGRAAGVGDSQLAPLGEAERAKLIELIRQRAEAESRGRAARPTAVAGGGTSIKSSEQSRGLLAAAGPEAASPETTVATSSRAGGSCCGARRARGGQGGVAPGGPSEKVEKDERGGAAAATPAPTAAPVQSPERSHDLLAAQNPRTPEPAGPAAPTVAPTGERPAAPSDAPAATPAPPAKPMELVPPLEGTPQPRVVSRTPVVHLDDVWKGQPAVFRFELANEGEAPLLIRVKPCCGAKLTGAADRTIPPGESDVVEIVFQTVRRGPIGRKVMVATNDRAAPEIALECVANVRTGLKVEPFTAAFGNLDRGAGPQERTLMLTRGDGGPIAPRVAATGHPNVTARIEEIAPGERYALHVTVGPPWPNGPLSGALEIETGVPEDPRENIPVFASVAPRLAAVPAQFLFDGELKADSEQTLRLRWAGGPPGQITGATTNIKDAEVTFTPAGPDVEASVTLRVPAGYTPDARAAYFVTIRTDDPEAPQIQVPVAFRRVTVVPPGTAERIPGGKPPRPR